MTDRAPLRAAAPVTPGDVLVDLLARASELATEYGLSAAAAVSALVAGWAACRAALRGARHAHLCRDARQITIHPPPEADPAGADTLWSNLVGLLRPAWKRLLTGQPHITFEYAWGPTGMCISMWIAGRIPPRLVEHAVEAAWPGALTSTHPPSQPIPPGAPATGGTLRLARPDWLPLRHDHPADPLRALTGAAAALAPGHRAAVQILARPVTGRRLRNAPRAAAALRVDVPAHPARRLLDLLTPASPSRAGSASPDRAAIARAVLDKAAHPQWEILIRYAVTTPPAQQGYPTGSGRPVLRGGAHALASAFALYTGHNQLARHRLRRPARALAGRRMGRGDLVSVPELAALAHLPLDTTVPGLARAGARTVPPPPAIPSAGPGRKLLGTAGSGRAVALGVGDARHHLHVLGATGSGKSTLLAQLILQDAAVGRGLIVIDPKGDLVADLLPRLPAGAANRVVLLDPDDPAPPSLNVLRGPDPDLATDNLVGIFGRIFADYWGPRTDDILRAACLTLGHDPAATLADVPRLLGDHGYRRRVTERVTEPILGGFWAWYDQLSEPARAHVVGPLMNKLRAVLLRPFARATLGQQGIDVNLGRVLDGGICLVRVPKGVLGADTARLVGSFVLAKTWEAATHRARLGQHARADAAVYLDECHNFLTLPHGLDDMLAEARAYRLSLVLAHQNLAQLPRDTRDAVSANARNKIYFAVAPDDARALDRHVHPSLSAHDLANLAAYQAAARLIVDAAEQPAFTLTTTPLPPAIAGRARVIRAAASARRRAARSRPARDDPRLRWPTTATTPNPQPPSPMSGAR
jgi:Helicase HerA, central domain/TraM recognition site of TraD and TraG